MNSFFKFFWMALAAAGLCIIPSASDEIVFANAHAPGGRGSSGVWRTDFDGEHR